MRARRNSAPPPPCDGWTLLTPQQAELGHRYLEIMQQMNRPTYSPADPQREVRRMAHPPCEYYYFGGSRFELALGLKWIRRVKRFRVMSTGFVGAITAAEALDRIAAKLREFALRKRVDRLIAVQPWQMESPRILEMYQLLRSHPLLRIRGGHHLPDGEYLWIRFAP